MATFKTRRRNSPSTIQKIRVYTSKVCKLQRVVFCLIIFLSLFHIFRQFRGGKLVYTKTDVVPAIAPTVYFEELENEQIPEGQFHGEDEIIETEKFRDLLLFTEEKVEKQIKEGYHSQKSEENLWILCSKR